MYQQNRQDPVAQLGVPMRRRRRPLIDLDEIDRKAKEDNARRAAEKEQTQLAGTASPEPEAAPKQSVAAQKRAAKKKAAAKKSAAPATDA